MKNCLAKTVRTLIVEHGAPAVLEACQRAERSLEGKNPYAVCLGQLGGRVTAERRTPEERRESARRAGLMGGRPPKAPKRP